VAQASAINSTSDWMRTVGLLFLNYRGIVASFQRTLKIYRRCNQGLSLPFSSSKCKILNDSRETPQYADLGIQETLGDGFSIRQCFLYISENFLIHKPFRFHPAAKSKLSFKRIVISWRDFLFL